MSDIFTNISHPDLTGGAGLSDWGEKTPEEMIAALREYHQYQYDLAKRILDIPADQFDVAVVRGSRIQKHMKTLQVSSLRTGEA